MNLVPFVHPYKGLRALMVLLFWAENEEIKIIGRQSRCCGLTWNTFSTILAFLVLKMLFPIDFRCLQHRVWIRPRRLLWIEFLKLPIAYILISTSGQVVVFNRCIQNLSLRSSIITMFFDLPLAFLIQNCWATQRLKGQEVLGTFVGASENVLWKISLSNAVVRIKQILTWCSHHGQFVCGFVAFRLDAHAGLAEELLHVLAHRHFESGCVDRRHGDLVFLFRPRFDSLWCWQIPQVIDAQGDIISPVVVWRDLLGRKPLQQTITGDEFEVLYPGVNDVLFGVLTAVILRLLGGILSLLVLGFHLVLFQMFDWYLLL